MAKGSRIVITGEPRGRIMGGIIVGTPKPGTMMAWTGAYVGGRRSIQAAAPGTAGKSILKMILMEDNKQGKTMDDAYVAGTYGEVYCIQNGDECNVRAGSGAGTSNSFAAGDRLELNTSGGYLIPETGSPQETIAESIETLAQQAGQSLLACQFYG
jgi:hypothetical protein